MIGSISERKELKSEIEFSFMESLKSDKEKDEVELAEETNKLAKVKSMNVNTYLRRTRTNNDKTSDRRSYETPL